MSSIATGPPVVIITPVSAALFEGSLRMFTKMSHVRRSSSAVKRRRQLWPQGHASFKYVTGVNMAAHDDSNKPKCKANVNNDRERDFVTVYKVNA